MTVFLKRKNTLHQNRRASGNLRNILLKLWDNEDAYPGTESHQKTKLGIDFIFLSVTILCT